MPSPAGPRASDTRRRLIEAGTEAFAEVGAFNASLVEITRRAGQRNRGAVHYHFGSRDGLLAAVLERHSELLSAREQELLDHARTTPADDLGSVLEAVVRPSAELAETGNPGRRYLVILGQLVGSAVRLGQQVQPAGALEQQVRPGVPGIGRRCQAPDRPTEPTRLGIDEASAHRAGASGSPRTRNSCGGSPGVRFTSKSPSGTDRPSPRALRNASLRVQAL